MLRTNLGILAIIMSGSLALTACGSDGGGGSSSGSGATGGSGAAGGSGGSGGTGGSGNAAGTGGSGGEPMGTDMTCADTDCELPPEDPAAAAPSGDPVTVAVRKLYLGDTDRDDTPNPQAWQNYGYNLDDIVSTKTGANHCSPQMGANPASVKGDGTGGIDNSFGANLLPIITGIAADAASELNTSIEEGSFTVMLHNDALTLEGGMPADQSGVSAKLYAGADMGMNVPAWDGSFTWDVLPEGLNDANDIESSQITFASAFVANGVWVSGSAATVDLNIAISGFELTLSITNAVISADISDPANTTGGIIAGVLETEALINELRGVAGALDPNLCSGSTFDSIAQNIRAASDIMADGSNGDSDQTCDAISIGLGFDAGLVTRGVVAPATEPGEDPCAM